MKALLIDPYKQTITEVHYPGDYKDICAYIQAHRFDHVRINDTEGVFVDDEGLLTVNADSKFFIHSNWISPVAGYGLVLGDSFGESVDTQLTVDDLQQDITWVSLLQAVHFPHIRPFLEER